MLRKLAVLSVFSLIVAGCNGSQTNPIVPLSQLALYVSSVSTTVRVYALPFSSTATPTVLLSSGLSAAMDVTADASGHLFVLDNGPTPPLIYQFNRPVSSTSNPTATITVTGTTSCYYLTSDPNGNLWVSCTNAGVKEIAGPFTATGSYNATIAATLNGIGFPYQLTFDANGDLFVADGTNDVVQIFKAPVGNGNTPSGSLTLTPTGPQGVALDSSGNVYADEAASLRKWNAPISMTTFNRAADVIDTNATSGLSNVRGLGADTVGNLYVGTCVSPTVGGVAVFANVASTFTSSSTPAFTNSTTACAWSAKVSLK
jgi:hypothetical protein